MRYYLCALLSIFLLASCNHKDSNANLHIAGNVKGLKKGVLYIKKIVDTSFVSIDTIEIDGDSHFVSELQIDSPEMYYLFVDGVATKSMDNSLSFFAEPGNINIETSLNHFSEAKINGSRNQVKYEEFRKVISRFNDQNLSLTEQKFDAFKDKNIMAIDSIELRQNKNLRRRYLYVTNFALNNKDYEVSPYVALTEIPDINLKYMDTIQKSMTPKVAKSKYGKTLIQFYKDRKKQE